MLSTKHLPPVSWVTVTALVGSLVFIFAIITDAEWISAGSIVFAITLLVPPLVTRPSPLVETSLGRDSLATRLATASTKSAVAMWVALGAIVTWVTLTDAAATTAGVLFGLLVAVAIIVASATRRLTTVSMLAVSTREQAYPRVMALALSLVRVTCALGFVALGFWGQTQIVALTLATICTVLLATAGALTVYALARREQWTQENFDALAALEPVFAVHVSGPSGSAYQVAMWLPYLERADAPFVLIVREAALFQEISALTTAPAVFARTLADLDRLTTLGFGTAFYVNNGVKNGHLVRRSEVHHVQLLHGESDKVSSRNPVTLAFDSVFVAGQAAIDRYWNHGIHIPRERFVIVGRPQVEAIEPARELTPGSQRTVLYAPTWNGFFGDAEYSSLPLGVELVESLLRAGAKVIFRPHPYSHKSRRLSEIIGEIDAMLAADSATTGTDHVFGARATTTASTNDVINASDVMISDVSSVPIDYLYSEKPQAIVEMIPDSLDRTPGCATLATGAYVVDASADFDALVRNLLHDDPLASARSAARDYYLSDHTREDYAELFVAAVRDVLAGHAHATITDRGAAGDGDATRSEEIEAEVTLFD